MPSLISRRSRTRKRAWRVPGEASHKFLPGLRSPTANDAQGDLVARRWSPGKGQVRSEHWSGLQNTMGNDGRLARCRLLSVRDGMLCREQHSYGGADWQDRDHADRTGRREYHAQP